MFSIFEFLTTWHIIYALGIGIIGLGFCAAMALYCAKGLLWLFGSSHRLLSWLWQRLTGKAPTSHGSSHWATAGEIEASGLLNETGLPLAKQLDGRVLREPLQQGISICAPPRSHKSFGIIMPMLREFSGSCVVNDLRSELYEHTHLARESYGPVIRYAPTEKQSASLNPLDLIRWRTDQQHGDLQRVATGLLSPEPGQAISEYQTEAIPFLTALMVDRYEASAGHLGAVLDWLTDPRRSLKAKLDSLLQSQNRLVASAARRMMDRSEARQGAILMALESALNIFSDPLVSEHTSRSDIDLDLQFGAVPISVYCCSPFSDQQRLRPLWCCLLDQLMARWSTPGETPRHRVLVCLDEAMALGRLPQLESAMSYLAGFKVQVVLAYQNRRQVFATYGPNSPLLDSIPTSVFFTPEPTDRVTLDEISTALGTTTAVHATVTESRSFLGLLQRTAHGEQRSERPLMYPDEIARLGEERCLLFTKAHPPVYAWKLDATPPPELIDLSAPTLKRVAMVAGAVLFSSTLATWALWPRHQPPTLALTTETRAMTLPPVPPRAEADPPRWTPGPGEVVRKDAATPAPQAEAAYQGWGTYTSPESYAEAVAIVLPDVNAGKPWRVASQDSRHGPMTIGSSMSGLPHGRFATQAQCQVSLHEQAERTISQLRQQAATQRNLRLEVANTPNFVSWTLNPGHAWTEQHRAAWCYLAMEEE